MIGLAQLYRRDVPNLPTAPQNCDLLQVFWCPFSTHGPGGYDLNLYLRWRRSWEVGEVLNAPPQPLVAGSDGFVPEPCVLHPEQVVTYPFAGLLPLSISEWEYFAPARRYQLLPVRNMDLSDSRTWLQLADTSIQLCRN